MIILYAALVLGGAGLICGLLLALASRYLSVPVDTRVSQITEALPNANCGGCGFAGCSAFAAAVVKGEAKPDGCSAGGESVAKAVAKIMGVDADGKQPVTAAVICCGTTNCATVRYEYEGIADCDAAARLGGGQKSCTYACLGFGTCEKKCSFGAIAVENGVAHVDEDKCTGCGICASVCPKHVIAMIPKKNKYFVGCSSKDKGVAMKDKCTAGCIACRICEKNCPSEAIAVVDNRAVIDYDKCTGCGICKSKCPKNIIIERKA